MLHLRLALRYPAAVLGACACFVACHWWACKPQPLHTHAEET